jgi:hypothetical protein
MPSFSGLARSLIVAGALSASASVLACQPAPAPAPPPPPLPGESPDDYDARVLAEQRARQEQEAAELRAARSQRESTLWAEAPRILAVEVIEGPRIRKQKRAYREMEIRLRPLVAARGFTPERPFVMRYRMEFNICGYEGGEHFRSVQTGDRLALFAAEGEVRYDALLGAISQAIAVNDDTISLLGDARR